jgi:hypothetical protein
LVRLWSWLQFPFSSCHFSPYSFFFARHSAPSLRGAAPRAPSLRSAALCACSAARVVPGCAARAFPVLPCAALRGAKPRSAGNAQGSTGNARARRRAFLHLDGSASTRRRLSYRRHTQRRNAMRLSSCSAAIDACRTPTALPAQVSTASSCPAHPLPPASAARLAPPVPQAGGPLLSARGLRARPRLAP